MRSTHLSRLTVVALVLAASACSDSTAPEVQPVDLSSALSEMSLSSYVPASLGIGGAAASGLAIAPGACGYNAASQSFACAAITQNGVTLTRSYQLLSASGTPLPSFDASVAAIRTTSAIKGTMTFGTDHLTLDHAETMTLSGLRTNTHVLDGTQTTRITGSYDGFASDETITSTIAGLQLDRTGATKYPKAGTITTVMVDGTGGTASTETVTMTFNGTSKVSVTFTYGASTQKCTLDLAAPSATALACS